MSSSPSIAFVGRDGQLRVMPVTGGLPRQVSWSLVASGFAGAASSEAEDARTWPAWSPDGQQIAFVTNRDGNYEIYAMNADGRGLVNLTRHEATDQRPAWSPDGRQIAFVSDRGGLMEIYVMDADGNNVRKLVERFGNADWPSWLPGQ